MSRQLRLAGRGCVITGATGMAAAAARRFVDEGARVVAISIEPHACLDVARYVRADLAEEAEAEAAFAAARDELGRLDALFAVAGGSGRRHGDGLLHETSLAAWDATMALNATPAFLAAREAVRWMLDQEPDDDGLRGSIVLMASVSAFDAAPAHFGTHAYASAKAAILGLTRIAAATYVERGIRVNAVAPATVATPMAARASADEATVEFVRRKQPLSGGMLDAEDVADAAAYLCSADSRRVTGQTLVVDAGWSLS